MELKQSGQITLYLVEDGKKAATSVFSKNPKMIFLYTFFS